MASDSDTGVERGGEFDDEMFSAAYDELRRIAYKVKRGSGSQTLNPTALVHEAYIRLAGAGRFQPLSPQHLKHTVVRAMKFLLVDAARRQSAASRGGGDAVRWQVSLDQATGLSPGVDPTDVLAVSMALEDLAGRNPAAAQAFELQFYGGLSIADIAGLLEVSEKKVQRLLQFARSALTVLLASGRRNSPDPAS